MKPDSPVIKKAAIGVLSLLLLLTGSAQAGQFVPKWSFEKNVVVHGAGTGERLYGVEYLQPISSNMLLKVEGGGWIARQADRKSSLFASAAWGYRVAAPWGMFAEAYLGPGLIQYTDSQLGGHFQIFHSINLGWLQDGWGLGLGFTHISNAGLTQVNRGRDFAGFRFIIPLGGP